MTTEKPSFSATYHNIRFVPTRGVMQIVFEVPIEDANTAIELLGGVPRVDEPVFFNIEKL